MRTWRSRANGKFESSTLMASAHPARSRPDLSANQADAETAANAARGVLAGEVRDIALFLDCDGTMLDIAATPSEVKVPPGLLALLHRISDGLGGAVAILTGRQLAEIDVLMKPTMFVGAGVHGSELRTALGGPIVGVASSLPNSLVEELVRRAQKLPGVIVEPKGPGIAVHYRLAPHLKDSLEAALRSLLAQYQEGLVLCPGRKLFEIIPAGHSKGTALETILALPEFAGRRPVMIGDDHGDIPALAAANRLGGAGLRVAGDQFGQHDVEFKRPAEVVAWLEEFAERLGV
jgi:trehalose 6-phosphate phosphatase